MLVSKPTHGGGAPLGIDLEGGTAKISIPRPPAPVEVEPADSTGSESADVSPAPGAGQDPPTSP